MSRENKLNLENIEKKNQPNISKDRAGAQACDVTWQADKNRKKHNKSVHRHGTQINNNTEKGIKSQPQNITFFLIYF